MPLYEFKCNKCENILEKICKYSEIENQVCSVCNEKLHRNLTATENIKFNGIKATVSM